MIHFDKLSILDTHIAFLQKKIKKQNTLFLVGGCIRDLLLWTGNSPIDIDFTMAGKPEEIYKRIDKVGLSHFITEKFGTITLIRKAKNKDKDKNEVKYELTPLRTEWGYEDFRHPGEITRSNDILLDAMRRDFTVNCIYYYSTKHAPLKISKSATAIKNDDELVSKLNKYWFLYIANENLFILQSPNIIEKLFADGLFQKDELPFLTNQLTENHIVKTTTHGKSAAWNLKFLIDPSQGMQDIIKRKLRAVGDPDKRFTEDALRMIRALRFVSVINEKLKNWKVKILKGESIVLFDFIKETWNSIKKNSALLGHVAKERIKDELSKAFIQGDPFGFTSLLDEAKLLPILFPALMETKNVEQPVRYHPFDVYAHTLLTLFELQKLNKDYLVRFAMLYHDVGKVDQFEWYEEGLSREEIRAILAGPTNHRRSSAEYVKKDFVALGFSNKEIDEMVRYVNNHHKMEEIMYSLPEKRERKIRAFLSEAGIEKFRNILDITIADRLWQYNPLQNSSDITDVHEIKKIMERLHKQEGQFTMKQLAVSGNDLMRQFKLKAWPRVGELLEIAMERVIDDIKERNTKEKIFCYLAPKTK
jgi:tRNA nucleotidyltransferase (CCA-adding enzyme)